MAINFNTQNYKLYTIRIHGFNMDSPAKSFVLCTKYHSGYNSVIMHFIAKWKTYVVLRISRSIWFRRVPGKFSEHPVYIIIFDSNGPFYQFVLELE